MSQLLTYPLPVDTNKFIAPNPIAGSGQNLLNNLAFFFPREAANATNASEVIASFSSLQGDGVDNEEKIDQSKTFGVLLSGMPVYGSVELGNVDPQNKSGNQYTGIDGNTYVFSNIVLPIALVTVTQPTNIVKTRITGRPGEIKQYIGALDKTITINAVVNMPNDNAPIALLQNLQQIKDAAVPIPVTNYFLNALNISYIVIEDLTTPQEEGSYSNLAFTITACSDIPLSSFLP